MNQTGPGRTSRYRYVVCATIFLSYILVYFHRLCPAVIALDMQEAFNASGTLLGVLGSAYFYPYALMQLPVGLLADSWGPRKTVASFLFLAFAGSLLMGTASGLGLAILGRVLVGFGVSTIFVCNFKLLAEWFTAREFAFMGGLFMAAGGIGVLSASAPLAWVSTLIGWRMTLVVVGVMTLVMALIVYVIVRDKPEDMGLPALHPSEPGASGESVGLWQGMGQVLTATRFWPLAVYSFTAIGTFFSLAGLWGGPYLMQVYGLSKPQAGAVLSMGAFSLIAGSPVLSFLSNVVGRKNVFLVCSGLLIFVFGLFALLPEKLPLSLLYLLFFSFSLAGGATGQITATVAKELFPLRIAGTSVGALNLFPFLGGAIFQVVIGVILSGTGGEAGYTLAGYRFMFLLCTANAVVSLIAACLLTETLEKKGKALDEIVRSRHAQQIENHLNTKHGGLSQNRNNEGATPPSSALGRR
jgi:sugar phosphate permease